MRPAHSPLWGQRGKKAGDANGGSEGTSGEGESLKSGPGEVARYHPPGGSSGGRAENGLASLHREGQHGEVEPRAASVIPG